jgi:metal-sulfur cluster biosynthetic enzyme
MRFFSRDPDPPMEAPKPEESSASKVVWEADTSHPELMVSLREKFREVVDPEIGMNIIELGLVRDVSIDDNEARIKIILTTPYCPYGPALLETSRLKAVEALHREVTLEMGMEMWDFSMMEDSSAGDWGLF